MSSGSFIPFAQYSHDLTRTMSGLCQIYPSRHITVNINAPRIDIEAAISAANSNIDGIRREVSDLAELDYGRIRSELYKAIYTIASPVVDDPNSENAPAMGEINFISHELQGGWMYNDIYVHVTPEEGKSAIILQESGFDVNPKRTGLDYDVTTKEYRVLPSDREVLKFNAVILYYNLHMIDPTSKTADTQPIVIDMPLGIYLLNEEVNVQIENKNIYNQGAAWSTRIVSRIATKGTIEAASADRNQEYATLARVLSEFGNIAETMDDILHRREVASNNNSLALSPEDIKSYLEEFRQLREVNVPYIKDNHWFVNGRDLGPVSGEVNWVDIFNEWLGTLDTDMLSKVRGPEGKQGPQGPPGEPGADGQPGKDGMDGAKGEKGDPGPVHVPVVELDENGFLHVDGEALPYCLKGQPGKDGEPGRDGNPGAPGQNGARGPQGDTGPAGPQGPKGDRGPAGPQGPPGKDGSSADAPTVSINDDGYLVVNGNAVGPCLKGPKGDKGDKGEPGKDGNDGNDADTGIIPPFDYMTFNMTWLEGADYDILCRITNLPTIYGPDGKPHDNSIKSGDNYTNNFFGWSGGANAYSGVIGLHSKDRTYAPGIEAVYINMKALCNTHMLKWMIEHGLRIIEIEWQYFIYNGSPEAFSDTQLLLEGYLGGVMERKDTATGVVFENKGGKKVTDDTINKYDGIPKCTVAKIGSGLRNWDTECAQILFRMYYDIFSKSAILIPGTFYPNAIHPDRGPLVTSI